MLYTIGNRRNYLATFRKMAGVDGGTHDKGKGGYAVLLLGFDRPFFI